MLIQRFWKWCRRFCKTPSGNVTLIFCYVSLFCESVVPLQNSNPAQVELISQLFQRIEKSQAGFSLLEKLKTRKGIQFKENLLGLVEFGDISRTDATLVRHYEDEKNYETSERKIRIFLKKDQAESELLMDFIHELVHAQSENTWNPYDPHLTMSQYIQDSIEGDGGEIDAFYTECLAGQELFKHSTFLKNRCGEPFESLDEKIIKENLKMSFYNVGEYFEELKILLGREFHLVPYLSDREIAFFSSHHGFSYPYSLALEYLGMTKVACENVKKRIENRNRFVGDSASGKNFAKYLTRDQNFYYARCRE